MPISCYVAQTGVYIYLQITCEINKTLLTRYFKALFITLGLISRPSATMLSLAQHPDYAQHLSVYVVSCTVFSGKQDPSVTNQDSLNPFQRKTRSIRHKLGLVEPYLTENKIHRHKLGLGEPYSTENKIHPSQIRTH